MLRFARNLLVAVALLWAQHGGLLHALEHAVNELGIASLDHETEECVAYDALGHALHGSCHISSGAFVPLEPSLSPEYFPAVAARIAFDSRAPPYSA